MYLTIKFLHIGGAIVSLGAMLGVLVLGWTVRGAGGRVEPLQASFERLVSTGGMMLVATGAALAHLRGWNELFHTYWMPAALAMIFLALLIERRYVRRLPLHVFAIVRTLPYLAVLALMVFKPA